MIYIVIEMQQMHYLSILIFVWIANLWKPGQFIVKVVQIISPKCLLGRVKWCFNIVNFITQNENSQQNVALNIEMSHILVFQVLGIYFLEPVTRTQL